MVAPWLVASASATGQTTMSVGGLPIDGSVQATSAMTVSVAAPAGIEEVKLVLDGVYLGETQRAPYQFAINATAGAHRIMAHWSSPADGRVTAKFTVAGAGAPTGTPPAITPPVVTPPVVTPPVVTPPVTAPGVSTIVVSSAPALSAALATALPGQTIQLADGVYTGKFVASASGTAAHPVTLIGSRAAILTTGGIGTGYGLHITGSYWVVNGISVTQSGKGIVLDGSVHTALIGVNVGFTGDEGVHFRHASAFSSITGSVVHDTGLTAPGYGEGVYIGSAKSNWASVMGSASTPDNTDHVVVQGNSIFNTAAEGVDIKEGTTGGSLIGNVFTNAGYSGANFGDSWVDVKGNNYVISGNSGSGTKTDAFQVHQALAGWGNNTVFTANFGASGVPGYLVNVGSGVTGTIVHCQSTFASRGLSNQLCVV